MGSAGGGQSTDRAAAHAISSQNLTPIAKISRGEDRANAGSFDIMAGFWWFYAAVGVLLIVVAFRHSLAIRKQSEAAGEIPQMPAVPLTGSNRLALAVSIHLGCFSWLIYLAWHAGDYAWAWIIATAMILLGAWYLYRLRGKKGTTAWRTLGAHAAVLCGTILVVLNLRLDVWLAPRFEVSVAEMHRLHPMWLIPALTLALLLWIGLVIAITKPKRRAQAFCQWARPV